jgi:hypothetical protein
MPRRLARNLSLLLAMLVSAGCDRAAPPLTHEMYVWQLAWTPAVSAALAETAPAMTRVHVLALEIDPVGGLRQPSLDTAALRALSQPLVAVVRIDGRVSDLPPAIDLIRDMLRDWQRQQLPLQALEIDFDCGTAQLERYTHFLADLKPQLPGGTHLMITALPAWMASPRLPELIQLADQVVLQVHSVMNPVQGLFDADQAYAWTRQYAKISGAPFLIALPTYGSQVRWDEAGHVVAVTSETSTRIGGGVNRELAVEPAAMAAFVQRITRHPVRDLAGIAWFRMPTAADERAWSIATFLAVVRADPLQHSVIARLVSRGAGGDIVIENTGALDAPVPQAIQLRGNCREADAINGFVLRRIGGALQWTRTTDRMMRAGAVVSVGWANCDPVSAPLEVSY